MKKIVVSTFNYSNSNYGALLQSCALSRFLSDLGYDVFYITIKNRNHNRSIKTNLKIWFKKIVTIRKNQLFQKRKKKFRAFAEKTQNQIVFDSEKALFQSPPKADVYLSGSDQVWNPVNIHADLFLAYTSDDAKRISYAASMGHETIPAGAEARFAKYITRYQSISVREDSMLEIIRKYTDLPITQNIDPVFLMTRGQWEELEEPYKNIRFDRYILAYILWWDHSYNEEIQKLKQRTGLPIVSVSTGNLNKIPAEQVIYDASPGEFLYLMHNAAYVVTSSFHGTAMSILYHKDALAVTSRDKPNRVQSLMRHFGIPYSDKIFMDHKQVDFEKIDQIIRQDQEQAKTYLVHSIEDNR